MLKIAFFVFARCFLYLTRDKFVQNVACSISVVLRDFDKDCIANLVLVRLFDNQSVEPDGLI